MSSRPPPDFAGLLALCPSALLLLDRAARVLYVNPAAERALAWDGAVSVKDTALSLRRKEEDRDFRDSLVRLTPDRPAATLCLRSREGFPVILIDLALLDSGTIAARITDLAARPVPSPGRLRHVLGLTVAEARVASAMLSGLGLSAIAGKYGVEPETVRSQAKRIRAKAGARSQNQLLGVLARIGPRSDGADE